MDKAKKKFSSKKEIYTKKKKKGLGLIEEDSEKNRENDLMSDDNPAGAPADDSDFESKKIEDNVDYTDGGQVT